MPRWQRVYLCATCAVIVFALAYTLCDWGQWTRLWYLPYENEWTVAPIVVGLWIVAFSRVILALNPSTLSVSDRTPVPAH